MSGKTWSADDELDFPQQFIDQSEELAKKTDDGDAWAQFMYGEWFVCPTSRLADVVSIGICRRRHYVPHGADNSERLDVVAESDLLSENSCAYGFELPHVSLRDMVILAVDHLFDADGSIRDIDKPDAIKLIDDIESTVASAITELRDRLK